MRFLGLDVSKSCTGWGLYSPDEVDAGTLRCPIKPPFGLVRGKIDAAYSGRVGHWYCQNLDALLVKLKPDSIGVEQPLPGNPTRTKKVKEDDQNSLGDNRMEFQKVKEITVGGTSFDVVHFLNGLVMLSVKLAVQRNVPVVYVPSQSWRSTTGVGKPPKSSKTTPTTWYKNRAKELCSELGYPQKSGDAAEGLLIAFHLHLENSPQDLFAQKKAV
ncbi:hypothetical protein PsAD2_02985 [Pseudovibrio axinellae]|uniref:Uncharacterized protein n=1 Tax=Pseudovibrio axinellae TaxID=989403 RepID=A0A165XF56_9HYPH|nr:hypothetical protein [Pseudovibrio axinellae]KZL17649.1 hypothetical protein PsAD2_02985 [Pseudovibrio axinellae]SER44997.1 hypothetical protein SAMN05421798_11097 [Pseudovibrio axinellae]